jgi:hypothetical protein
LEYFCNFSVCEHLRGSHVAESGIIHHEQRPHQIQELILVQLFENGAISLFCNRIPHWADRIIEHVPAGSVTSPVAIVIALFINGLFKDHFESSSDHVSRSLVDFLEEFEGKFHPHLYRQHFIEQLFLLIITHVLSVGNTICRVIEDHMPHDTAVELFEGVTGLLVVFI